MAKIVISNAIANIAELKSRLRGVKTPGKRILAAAFKNNDYSALIGELLTRIELYQSLGVLDYKLKDVDTIQGMKFKFGFESVLASTLKASGVSSSPRVVQQIVRQQQVVAPQKSMIGEELNPLAIEYARILTDSANRRLASKKAVDLFIGLSNRIKNVLSIGLDESLDRINVIEKNFNDFGMEDEDGKWNDIAEVRSEFSDFASQFGIDADDADDIFISIKDYTPSTGAPKVPFSLQNVPNNNSNRYLAFMSQAVKAGYISPEILNITKSLSHKERNDMFDIVADGFDAIEKTTLHYTSTGYEQDSDAVIDAIRPISAAIKSDLTHYGFDLNQAKQILIGIDRIKGY